MATLRFKQDTVNEEKGYGFAMMNMSGRPEFNDLKKYGTQGGCCI